MSFPWTKARATRKCIGGRPVDDLLTHCSTIILKDAPYSANLHSVFFRPEHDLRSYLLHGKVPSVVCLDAVLGKVHLSYWRFVVVRHGGNVCKDVYRIPVFQMSCCRHFSISPSKFFMVSPVGIQFTYNGLSETFFFFPVALKCWCGTIATMFSKASGRDRQDVAP